MEWGILQHESYWGAAGVYLDKLSCCSGIFLMYCVEKEKTK